MNILNEMKSLGYEIRNKWITSIDVSGSACSYSYFQVVYKNEIIIDSIGQVDSCVKEFLKHRTIIRKNKWRKIQTLKKNMIG